MRGLSNMSFNVRPWSRQWHIFWLSKPFGLDTTALESIVLSIMTNLKFCTCVRLFSLSFYYLHTIILSTVASPKPNWSILPVLSDLVEWYLWFRKSFNRIVRRETRKRGMPHERINKKTSITYFQWEISTNHKWEQGPDFPCVTDLFIFPFTVRFHWAPRFAEPLAHVALSNSPILLPE